MMNDITYTMIGDYNLPNLSLPEQKEVILGKWSMMREKYLKEHHKILYYNLLTKGKLVEHLATIQEEAINLEENLLNKMAKEIGLTEEMKAQNMMNWVQTMNALRHSIEEIVKEEIIFA